MRQAEYQLARTLRGPQRETVTCGGVQGDRRYTAPDLRRLCEHAVSLRIAALTPRLSLALSTTDGPATGNR